MDFIKYILFGLLQGFTEPIPISSSGHLLIFRHLFDSKVFNDLNFEIIVNFGSLIAILFVYRESIKELIVNGFKFLKTKEDKYKHDFRYIIMLIIATIPAGMIGFLFKDKIEEILSNIKVIGVSLLITALFLFVIRKIKGNKEDKDINWLDALLIGLFQMVALIPGISRSGATIVGGMLRDFKRETALKFSFLLYIPVSVASFILGVSDIDNVEEVWIPYLIGMVASAIMTYFATIWFINIMKKGKLIWFVIYCLIAGSLVIIFL